MLHRRAVLAGLAVTPLLARSGWSQPAMTVFKDPDCGCCGAWVDHVRQAGLAAEVRIERQMRRVKARLGVPSDLASCHTAVIGAYVVEGHVPADAILRLLAERPALIGIAVPGMPIGSPGMEAPGHPPEPFDVIGFGRDGQRVVFARHADGFRG